MKSIGHQFGVLMVCLACFGFVHCKKEKGLKIKGLEPSSGSPGGGGHVTIDGNGFEDSGTKGVNVYFGDRKARIIKFVGNDKLIVEAPQGDPGSTTDVTVQFDDAKEHVISKAYSYHPEPGSSPPPKEEQQ